MEPYIREKTANTPAIEADPQSNTLRIAGESYPENAPELYEPLLQWLAALLKRESHTQDPITVDLSLTYCNSSSSKALWDMLDMLHLEAETGRDVVVNWHYHVEDERSLEHGEEFQDDLPEISFNLLAYDDTSPA